VSLSGRHEVSVPGFSHEALVYGCDEELLATAVPFLRAGIEERSPTLVRLTPREEAIVLDALGGGDGITLLRSGEPESLLRGLRDTHAVVSDLASAGRVRMLGAVPHDPWAMWSRYEAAINVLYGPLPAHGVCPYDTRKVSSTVIDDVERTHPLLSSPTQRRACNPRFEAPFAFLRRVESRPDPLEGGPPQVELVDPSPRVAGNTVAALADKTQLGIDDVETIRLAVMAVVKNAWQHGRAPVLVRAWSAPDVVVAMVIDHGDGPVDPLTGILPEGASIEDQRSLFHVREAITDLAMFDSGAGCSVRLVQRNP
jgi:hypothetical protein